MIRIAEEAKTARLEQPMVWGTADGRIRAVFPEGWDGAQVRDWVKRLAAEFGGAGPAAAESEPPGA